MNVPSAKPGPKPALTHVAVIEAALELVDEGGLAALNLRRLAARLGVSAMTPYGYFADKDELLGGMVGHALAALRVDPDADSPWDAQLERAMRGMHDALERHPGVIELIMAEDGSDGGRLDEFRVAMIAMLVNGGLSRAQAIQDLRTLTSYVLGYTMLTRLRRGRGSRSTGDRAAFDHGLEQILGAIRVEAAG